MTDHGVSRSDSEIAQKSWTSGAPTSEPHELSAVIPGMIRSSGDSPPCFIKRPAITMAMSTSNRVYL